jgi:hypothetical protein
MLSDQVVDVGFAARLAGIITPMTSRVFLSVDVHATSMADTCARVVKAKKQPLI